MSFDLEKEDLSRYSPFRRCLIVLLKQTGWNGDSSFLQEYFTRHDNFASILNGLSHMNYSTETLTMRLDEIDSRLLPCLFLPSTNDPIVILERYKSSVHAYIGKLDTQITMPTYPITGTVLLLRAPTERDNTLHNPQASWFSRVLMRFKRHMFYALFISFLLALLSLAMPFFINLIFKKITTEQINTDLTILGYGLCLYLGASLLLTLIRARVQSVISVRMGFLVINEVIRRILFLPTSYTETAPINSQLARVKDFESIKEFFAGPAMTALLDMPFILILMGGLAVIDPLLAAIPFCSIVAFAIMALSIKSFVRTTNANAAQTNKDLQDFLLDALNNLKAVRNLGYTERWIERYRDLSSRSILAGRQSSDITALIINIAQGITSIAGLMTMSIGVMRIFSESLQPSLLMAAMLLTWRILAPMKTGFSVYTQVDRLRRSIDQIDRLMVLDVEKHDFTSRKIQHQLEGRVIVSQVSLRYGRDANPVLLGVSFDAKPGETIVILGHSGSGKSTLLKLLLAMYTPQTGHVLIDGKNTRQIDPIALRRSIAYMPSSASFITGTLHEHIRMINPQADGKTIIEALQATELEKEVEMLPFGLNTRVSPETHELFTPSFLRRFHLALILMKKSGLWILDNPGADMDAPHEKRLMATLAASKGKATIIIATQNPEYATLADRVLLLSNGRAVAFASPESLDTAKPPI